MIGLLIQTWRLFRTLGQVVAEPQGRALTALVALQLAIGTITYHSVEGWGWLDSLYFSVTTLATVGLGDLAPDTDVGKAFTIVFILSGVGIIAAFVSFIAQHATRRQIESRLGDEGADPGETPTDA
jgi:hypothetical protein